MFVSDDVCKAMKDTNERFCQKVVGEGKFEELDQVYTVDARVLPPGAPLMKGREAIRQFWQAGIAALGIKGARLTTLELEMTGDTAVEIGEAELHFRETGPATAKYVVHWKLIDGQWLWDKDIWNMN